MARFLADENFNHHTELKWWVGGFAMPKTAQEIYTQVVSVLSLDERLRLATLILNDLIQQNISVIERSDTWSEQDQLDLVNFSLQYAATLFSEGEETV